MGLFDMFKKKDAAPSFPVVLAADAAGAFVKMEDIPDEVFAQGILGQGCGIDPSEGKVYAPCDGEITQAPDTPACPWHYHPRRRGSADPCGRRYRGNERRRL